MSTVFPLQNNIQHYSWGDKTALFELFGITNPTDEPQAEIWMGAHPKSPSTLAINDQSISLLDAINQNPNEILGTQVASDFNNRLPFLFKVLNAGEPLSIQAHPSLAQAKSGFADENNAGIALTAFNRNYKDDNHKPELICALTEFKAMNGFRPITELIALLARIECPLLIKQLEQLKSSPNKQGLKAFYTWLMTLPESQVFELTEQAITTAKQYSDELAFETLLYLNSFYPNDIGIMCAVLLNVVELSPGQAMYLDAGELHAYLKGTGVEIMANSDNVLRGGLTPKHVDVPELLKTLSFNHGKVNILSPVETTNVGERLYLTPVSEFDFSVIELANNAASYPVQSVEILFCAKGNGTLTTVDGLQNISTGDSLLVPASLSSYQLQGTMTLYRATVPLSDPKN